MWGIIINPKSGKKALRRQRKYLFKTLKAQQIPFDYKLTHYAGHASELSREMVENGIKQLLVLGGDGTLSEVIDGIFHAHIADTSSIQIALIPRGTGNDWGRYWGLSRNYKAAIDVFLHGTPRAIDIGRLSYQRNGDAYQRYFINSVGFGIDCQTVHMAHELKYYLGSRSWLYVVALLAALLRYKPQKIKITTDAGFSFIGRLLTMNIGNGCYSGGGIRQNPQADPTDGLFHAMFVQKLTFMDIVKALPLLFNGRLLEHPCVHSVIARRFDLYSKQHISFETDGILADACGPYSIEILPQALQMVAM